ncbi:Phosphoribosylaminoimidazole carboxylase [Methanohalobium evestigatum Z-7303]|uniref:N5-carboxyaminoimidazole ribonucleotide mutase n=1 Tax=Methanohalobium evestigatum (strain ATCC BAA-1072 / DSM 3721 / NBRC 107634 / OCM 161 / Z-7303) TaxID=644295 RepID=D7EAW7_METEZ|nr:5-(carboxyamino)imidazole ribonucleotide mutase [Methanohalobium evestigatum]ADI74484.1 Phosphoribosylaminoimidazole carboxylase [Methanohalobium evestigatum Z-7303]
MVDVAIISGSESDKEIAVKATKVLDDIGYSYDVQVISAHRNPDELDDYVTSSDAKVFITIAGLSAALPGVVASKTEKPVIGVPVNTKLGGLDALLSTAQMPPGVPVATVGIDNGKNAANLAIRILNMLKK